MAAPFVTIVGAGPAGSSAAFSAMKAGANVEIFDPSPFPRHKVCGEFLSPEIAELITDLPPCPRIRRVRLYFEKHRKQWGLLEPAYGLSRHALDQFLLNRALERGARLIRQRNLTPTPPAVLAHGRQVLSVSGNRLFGFKAHFEGPIDDALDLFFFNGCYVGINTVEGGFTNVCGLAPEGLLKKLDFDVDQLLAASPALADRLRPLHRSWAWLKTGPLIYRGGWNEETRPGIYLAGDALGFVDPFTGSGMLSAIATGTIAGESAATALPVDQHMARCRSVLSSQYRTAAVFRAAIACGVADLLLPLLPGKVLFHLTRPRIKHRR
jgi:2-polyprenyl-6-methoxyphenol hydroxylase-like FAD-dependent oxidoreductase